MNTEEMIKVMQAYLDGKPIEYRYRGEGEWERISPPIWNWGQVEYRVKREPKIIFVNEYEDGRIYVHNSEIVAGRDAGTNATRVAVKYKEVIE